MKLLKYIFLFAGFFTFLIISAVVYWYTRPNYSVVRKDLVIDHWEIVNDGKHNAFTDMVEWNGNKYIAYTSSYFHSGSIKSLIVILCSTDFHDWKQIQCFDGNGEDIRDPKLAVINDKLFLYALKNKGIIAIPYKTVYSISNDGKIWSPLNNVQPTGYLLWRPKTFDRKTWYVSAYRQDHEYNVLLCSQDGINWTLVSRIYTGDGVNETDIQFFDNDKLISASCLNFSENIFSIIFGDPKGSTLIRISDPPYKEWMCSTKNYITRLDGPNLFNYNNKIFAVGRFSPELSWPFNNQGSLFNRTRTSIFFLHSDSLIYLTDLPSGGDTAYPGIIKSGDDLYISYYTSDIYHDFVWGLGFMNPTRIRIAHVNLTRLDSLAESKTKK